MGFFKDFKEDFADAVDEMIPGGTREDDEVPADSVPITRDLDVEGELSKLDGLLQQVSDKLENDEPAVAARPEPVISETEEPKAEAPKREKKKELKMDNISTEANRPAAPAATLNQPASDENA
ncbi:MAG: hypothetical protein J6N76_07310, partial [Lachnospiraceae bacterium]|nr:hypothetical protein [Lachnospiraceae bacterium]